MTGARAVGEVCSGTGESDIQGCFLLCALLDIKNYYDDGW